MNTRPTKPTQVSEPSELSELSKLPESNTNFWAIFFIFLKLGLTSFGGPVAHIAYFREAFVVRRQWFSEAKYADLVALCQFLPGPASSQVGFAIGLQRGGYRGGLAAWLGFTLPSAVVLMLFALGMTRGYGLPDGVLQGLKIVAVAVVVHAVWGMAHQLCQSRAKKSLAVACAAAVLLIPVAWGQLLVIALGGVIGWACFSQRGVGNPTLLPTRSASTPRLLSASGVKFVAVFFGLLLGLPIVASLFSNPTLSLLDGFYRAGALVFGGGHVVLPLLQAEVLPTGLVSDHAFLTGYGLAQAVPGPLFTFAAFLGTAADGIVGGVVAVVAIFLPSFLLVLAVLPVWEQWRNYPVFQSVLAGINAAVVGVLLAALYQPIWITGVTSTENFVLVLLAIAALMLWKLPVWVVVLGCATAGGVFL